MNSLLSSRIHYKFTYCFALSLLIHSFFGNLLSFSRNHYEFTIYFTIYFANSLSISLSISRIHYISLSFWNRPIRLFFTKLDPRLTSDDFLWPDWTWNNFEFQSSTKCWVETYVYLIYFDHPARFDSYWTSLTQVWPLMTLIELEKYKIWILEKILSRNICIFDIFRPTGPIWPLLDRVDPSLTSGDLL